MSEQKIEGEGTAESDWLTWLSRRHVQRLTAQEIFAGNRRLVVVAPHPDDEILACGGLLALSAKANFPVVVVAVTDGEASHGRADGHRRSALGEQRAHERRAGLVQLGIDPACVVRLKIADGGVAQKINQIFRRLNHLLQLEDVVVTTWSKDGHPDHEATAQAVRLTGCKLLQAPVWMWHWAKPADRKIPWANLVATELTDSAVQAKQNALAQHHSQLARCNSRSEPVLLPSIVERSARRHEYFFMCSNFP